MSVELEVLHCDNHVLATGEAPTNDDDYEDFLRTARERAEESGMSVRVRQTEKRVSRSTSIKSESIGKSSGD